MIEPNALYEMYGACSPEPCQDEQDSLRAEQRQQNWLRLEQDEQDYLRAGQETLARRQR
jgi:hypothetical protein